LRYSSPASRYIAATQPYPQGERAIEATPISRLTLIANTPLA
jgi:hypothetical protein